MKYKVLKPVYVSSSWRWPGEEIPSDVADFDYEKAARRGALEAPDGSEILNVSTGAEVGSQDGDSTNSDALAKAQAARQEAVDRLDEQKRLVVNAEAERDEALEQLGEYQEAVGELLPEGLTANARKALIAEGYVGKTLIGLLTDEQLDAVDGVAAASIKALREWAPYAGAAEADAEAGASAPASE